MSDLALKKFFSKKSTWQKPESKQKESATFALIVWLIHAVILVFFFSWIFNSLELPEKYSFSYEIFFGYVFLTGLPIGLLMWHYKLTLSDIGLKSINQPHRFVGLFLAGAVLLLLLLYAPIFIVISILKPSLLSEVFSSDQFRWNNSGLPFILKTLIVAPIFEELFMRGCLQAVFWKRFNSKIKAVLLSTLLFSLSHTGIDLTTKKIEGKSRANFDLSLEFIPEGLVYGSFYFLGGNNIFLPMALHSFRDVFGMIYIGGHVFSFQFSK